MGLGQKLISRGSDMLSAGTEAFSESATPLYQTTSSNVMELAGQMGNAFMHGFLGNAETDAPEVDPSAAWSDDSLRSRLDWRYEGQDGSDQTGSDPLWEVMNHLALPKPDADNPEALEEWKTQSRQAALDLNQLRADPKSDELAIQEYNRFRLLQEQAAERGDVQDLDQGKHPDHMASIQQLRCGSYIGEVLNVDPVYGALLNPTGGMTGPGNNAAAAPADSVSSFHGEAHDAFGYLRRHHDEGPGYMYASPGESSKYGGKDPGPIAPLTGQHSGFEKWNQLFQETGRFDNMTPQGTNEDMRSTLSSIPIPGLGSLVDRDELGNDAILENIPGFVEGLEDVVHVAGTATSWLFD